MPCDNPEHLRRDGEKRQIIGTVPCEVCGVNPSKDIRGGKNKDGVHGLWLTCQECINKINDMRKRI